MTAALINDFLRDIEVLARSRQYQPNDSETQIIFNYFLNDGGWTKLRLIYAQLQSTNRSTKKLLSILWRLLLPLINDVDIDCNFRSTSLCDSITFSQLKTTIKSPGARLKKIKYFQRHKSSAHSHRCRSLAVLGKKRITSTDDDLSDSLDNDNNKRKHRAKLQLHLKRINFPQSLSIAQSADDICDLILVFLLRIIYLDFSEHSMTHIEAIFESLTSFYEEIFLRYFISDSPITGIDCNRFSFVDSFVYAISCLCKANESGDRRVFDTLQALLKKTAKTIIHGSSVRSSDNSFSLLQLKVITRHFCSSGMLLKRYSPLSYDCLDSISQIASRLSNLSTCVSLRTKSILDETFQSIFLFTLTAGNMCDESDCAVWTQNVINFYLNFISQFSNLEDCCSKAIAQLLYLPDKYLQGSGVCDVITMILRLLNERVFSCHSALLAFANRLIKIDIGTEYDYFDSYRLLLINTDDSVLRRTIAIHLGILIQSNGRYLEALLNSVYLPLLDELLGLIQSSGLSYTSLNIQRNIEVVTDEFFTDVIRHIFLSLGDFITFSVNMANKIAQHVKFPYLIFACLLPTCANSVFTFLEEYYIHFSIDNSALAKQVLMEFTEFLSSQQLYLFTCKENSNSPTINDDHSNEDNDDEVDMALQDYLNFEIVKINSDPNIVVETPITDLVQEHRLSLNLFHVSFVDDIDDVISRLDIIGRFWVALRYLAVSCTDFRNTFFKSGSTLRIARCELQVLLQMYTQLSNSSTGKQIVSSYLSILVNILKTDITENGESSAFAIINFADDFLTMNSYGACHAFFEVCFNEAFSFKSTTSNKSNLAPGMHFWFYGQASLKSDSENEYISGYSPDNESDDEVSFFRNIDELLNPSLLWLIVIKIPKLVIPELASFWLRRLTILFDAYRHILDEFNQYCVQLPSLLSYFRNVYENFDHILKPCIASITELFCTVNAYKILAKDVTELFNLSVLKACPLIQQISAIESLLKQVVLQPSHFLTFPIEEQIESPSVLKIPLNKDGEVKWLTSLTGFSISFWALFKSQSFFRQEPQCNISHDIMQITCRDVAIVFSIENGQLSLRYLVKNIIKEKSFVLDEEALLFGTTWKHYVITVSNDGCFCLIINGIRKSSTKLTSAVKSIFSNLPVYLHFGYSVNHSVEMSYKIGSFLVLRDCMSIDQCFTIMACGPDCFTFCATSQFSKPLFIPYISKNVVTSYIDPNIIYSQDDRLLPNLKNHLIISFHLKKKFALFFDSNIRPNRRQSTGLFSTTSRTIEDSEYPSSILLKLKPVFVPEVSTNIVSSSVPLGGLRFYFYYFARVVESTRDEVLQSRVLNIFFTAMSRHLSFFEAFTSENLSGMLSIVLQSQRCSLGYHYLKVFFDHIYENDVVDSHSSDWITYNSTRRDVVIKNPQLIELLISNWKIWDGRDGRIFIAMLEGVQCSLNVNDSFLNFNKLQLGNIDFLSNLLQFLRECYEENLFDFSKEMSDKIIGILRATLESESNSLVLVIDFLLSLHQNNDTFVHHSPNSFYFISHLSEMIMRRNQFVVDHLEHSHNNGLSNIQSTASLSSISLVDDGIEPDDDSTDAVRHKLNRPWRSTASGNRNKNRSKYPSMMLPKCSIHTFALASRSKSMSDLPRAVQESFATNIPFKPDVVTPPSVSLKTDSRVQSSRRHVYALGIESLFCGMLQLLNQKLKGLNDSSAQSILLTALHPSVFAVLANNSSPKIRCAILEIFITIVKFRCEELNSYFIKQKGFYLLANQLYSHGYHYDLLNLSLSIFFGRYVTLDCDDGFKLTSEPSELQNMSLCLTLSFLESSIVDFNSSHRLHGILMHLFDTVDSVTSVLLNHGLLPTLGNVLYRTLLTFSSKKEACESLVSDIQSFYASITVRACRIGGKYSLQILKDVFRSINKVHLSIVDYFGEFSSEAYYAFKIETHVLKLCLDYLKQFKHSMARSQSRTNSRSSRLLSSVSSVLRRSTSYPHSATDVSDGIEYEVWEEFSPSSFSEMLMNPVLSKGDTLQEVKDISHRLDYVLKACIELLVYCPPKPDFHSYAKEMPIKGSWAECHFNFVKILFFVLEDLISDIVDPPSTKWKNVLIPSKSTIITLLKELMVFLLAPSQPIILRILLFNILNNSNADAIINSLFTRSDTLHLKIVNHVKELLISQQNILTSSDIDFAHDFLDKIKNVRSGRYNAINSKEEFINDDVLDEWEKEADDLKRKWEADLKKDSPVDDLLKKLQTEIAEKALEETHKVFDIQKHVMNRLHTRVRDKTTREHEDIVALAHLISEQTHERAPWYEPNRASHSYQLDQTEGPFRMKKRLEPCFINVSPKHIRNYDPKMPLRDDNPYLGYLFRMSRTSSKANQFLTPESYTRRLLIEQTAGIRHSFDCSRILPYCEINGELLLGDTSLYFVSSEDESMSRNRTHELYMGGQNLDSLSWSYDAVREIHQRLYTLSDIALEIFFTSGHSLMIAFASTADRDAAEAGIRNDELPNLVRGEVLGEVTKAWTSGYLTNFTYLTVINKIAGRTTNDLMQYPVFPFILSNFSSATIDLNDGSCYRDLSKPMSIQNPEKEKIFQKKYEDMSSYDFRSTTDFGPYHYSSLYSNSGVVLQYLVRLLPFTRMFLDYQGNNFDIPDRTFLSLKITWRLIYEHSMTDVKELIPEFFYLPEFLVNREHFEFGVRQDKEVVDDVILPPWAEGNPRLFILIHRQALESSYVSRNLCKWIDLIFGVKQRGRQAIEAMNVYRPCLYYGFDLSSLTDIHTRNAVEGMIKTYGQTPRQIFTSQLHQKGAAGGLLDFNLADVVAVAGVLGFWPGSSGATGAAESSPLQNVSGIRWGSYVGSPAVQDLFIAWSNCYTPSLVSLFALPNGNVAAVPRCCCLLYRHVKELGVHSPTAELDITWWGVLHWNIADSVIRFAVKGRPPWSNLCPEPSFDAIVCVCAATDSRYLFLGCSSGVIRAIRLRSCTRSQSGVKAYPTFRRLKGHYSDVTCMSVSRAFSLLVSGSKDGTVNFWDVNRLTLVKSIALSSGSVVTHLEIGETMGDVVVVSRNSSDQYVLTLLTINAEKIEQRIFRRPITAITISNAPEGISVNVVVVGFSDGSISFYEIWMLGHVKDLVFNVDVAVCDLSYRCDAQVLFIAFANGSVLAISRSDQPIDQKRFKALLVKQVPLPQPKLTIVDNVKKI